jgi:NAD(P)H-flavin reductase
LPAAVLASRRDAGAGLLLVSLDVDPTLARAYTAPGQYVELFTPRGNGYFVLAGSLGDPVWELLVRNAGDAADALFNAPIGSSFEVTAPIGGGFPVERATGRVLVLAVVGSALAVARPIVARRIAEGAAARTHVYVGARTPADVPLADEVAAWSADGVNVVLCLSRTSGELERGDGARREAGYVQDVMRRDVGQLGPSVLVFAAGPEGMLTAMRDLPRATLEVVTNV